MRFYNVDRSELLDWPVDSFWLAIAMMGRIKAEESLDFVRIKAGLGSKDGAKTLVDSLHNEMGTVFVEKARRDPNALNKLRKLAIAPTKPG